MFFKRNPIRDSFFNDINGNNLDKYQRKAIICENERVLVVAAAGSGKTLTIVGKVKYLIEKLGYNEKEIICLSFANETVDNLKKKLNYNVPIYTFHKLALNILKDNGLKYYVSNDNFLSYVVDEFFSSIEYNCFYKSLFMEYFNNKDYLKDICNNEEVRVLKNNIISFIKKIKCNNIGIKKIHKIIKGKLSNKEKIILIFSLNIFLIYIDELSSQNKIDFDDMITYATSLVKQKGVDKTIKYIIIDEYQDISIIRFNLIKEILFKTKAKLMCVGDDYQSIYGFSGSNISLFTNFFKYFPNGRRIDIKNTYRNSYELVSISVKFIMKNSFQLRKNIHATFLNKHPIILIYYDEDNYIDKYNSLLNYLYLEEKKEILVLSRYNSDIDEIKNNNDKNNFDIKYLTVHKSKGLEAESVILLNMNNSFSGFPSKILNNDVLSRIDKNEENILYAEERRLFYVALTRCKDKIYILVPRNNPSIFIEEIKNRCCELLLN